MSLQPLDLATFKTRPDGNLAVELERFGRLAVESPKSGIIVDVCIRRDEDREFKLFISTRLSDNPKLSKAALKANKGKPIGATYRLHADGTLALIEGPATAEALDKTTGAEAAAADAAPAEEPSTEPASAEETAVAKP